MGIQYNPELRAIELENMCLWRQDRCLIYSRCGQNIAHACLERLLHMFIQVSFII